MSEKHALLDTLFDRNDGKTLANIKFFSGSTRDLKAASAAAKKVLDQMWDPKTKLVSVLHPVLG